MDETSIFDFRLSNKERETVFQRIMHEGFEVIGDNAPPIDVKNIPWFNPELWRKGQQFAKENMLACSYALAVSYCYGLGVRSAGQVFYRGTMLNSNKSCFLALFHNLRTVTNWWWTDITDPNSEGAKQFNVIRRIHRLFAIPMKREKITTCRPERLSPACKKMAEDIRVVLQDVECPDIFTEDWTTWNPKINYSQSEASCFMMGQAAAFLLGPYHFGVSVEDGEKLRGYIHLLAIIGRMVGLEDRFNVCLCPDTELYHRIIKDMGWSSCKNADEITGYIWHTSFQYFPLLNHFMYPRILLFGICADELNLWKYLNFGEKVNLSLIRGVFYLSHKFPSFKKFTSFVYLKYWQLLDCWYSGKHAVHIHSPY